jgi:hypothetical protein
MPNIVNTNVSLAHASEISRKKFQKLCERLEGWGQEGVYQWSASDIFGVETFTNEEGKEDGPGYYSWNIENMGSKWCYFEEVDEDYFRLESAWSTPTELIAWISKEINAPLEYTSEDEFPNWVSCGIAKDGEIQDFVDWEWEEIIEMILDKFPEVKEGYDLEENDFYDTQQGEDAREKMYDVLWEEVYELQSTALSDMDWVYEEE